MKLIIGLSAAVVVLCVLSAMVGYEKGESWGRRVQQRSNLNLPGLVDVYGCGVDRFVRVDTNRCVRLYEVLTQLQPLPSTVNEVSLFTNRSAAFA
jgi:hypothetical protein